MGDDSGLKFSPLMWRETYYEGFQNLYLQLMEQANVLPSISPHLKLGAEGRSATFTAGVIISMWMDES